ncbi:phosphatase PAP2 family protein [Skermanella mucosa]|uniref:phosphatase PAP2 family protein n=1 Tax=Skermanella mucosa TaxID=1789672 RepID=UPI00192CB775|nr:phosphatase PAP2 family protein [Skermanella mucosa]UEM20988.1 phosphatase PAP2 family protein [Skermanella mucosa]
MRNPFTEDQPRPVRYSLWFLLFLFGHMLLNHLDRTASELARSADPGLLDIFRAITEAGDSKWTLVPTGVLGLGLIAAGWFILAGRRAAAMTRWAGSAFMFVFASVALSGIAVNIVKVIVGRARPKLLEQAGFLGFDPMILNANFHSFPSGHTNTAVAFALAVSFIVPSWRGALLAAACLIGLSRIMVNAHFMTDVVGGGALAVVTTYCLRGWFTSRGWVFHRGSGGSYRLLWPGLVLPLAAGRTLRRLRETGAIQPPGRIRQA